MEFMQLLCLTFQLFLVKIKLYVYKDLCTAKETTGEIENRPTEWKKIFENYKTIEKLISNIYKQFI